MPAIERAIGLIVTIVLTAYGSFQLGQHWGGTINAPLLDVIRVGLIATILAVAWGTAVAVALGWRGPRPTIRRRRPATA